MQDEKPVQENPDPVQHPRENKGLVYFNVKKLSNMGFSRFKPVPMASGGAREVVRNLHRLKTGGRP